MYCDIDVIHQRLKSEGVRDSAFLYAKKNGIDLYHN